jgi:hypothetical protein
MEAAANGATSCGLQIVGLHTRYPEALATLKEDWLRNHTQLETLSALAVWRQWIDDAGGDPRKELAFQAQLANYGHTLRTSGRQHQATLAARLTAHRVVLAHSSARHPQQTEPHWNLEALSDAQKPHE